MNEIKEAIDYCLGNGSIILLKPRIDTIRLGAQIVRGVPFMTFGEHDDIITGVCPLGAVIFKEFSQTEPKASGNVGDALRAQCAFSIVASILKVEDTWVTAFSDGWNTALTYAPTDSFDLRNYRNSEAFDCARKLFDSISNN